MGDDTKKKIMLGGLAAVVLGMGSWFFVFRGSDTVDNTVVLKKKEPKRDRRAGATTNRKKKKMRARGSSKPEIREKRTREYEETRTRPKKSRTRGGRKKKKKKNMAPLAFAPLGEELQDASLSAGCIEFLPGLPFPELDSYPGGRTA